MHYTLIGVFQDTRETFLGFVEASTPEEAIASARSPQERRSLKLLAVFPGRHKPLLLADENESPGNPPIII